MQVDSIMFNSISNPVQKKVIKINVDVSLSVVNVEVTSYGLRTSLYTTDIYK